MSAQNPARLRYECDAHQTAVLTYGDDPGVVCQAFLAWSAFLLGYPEQASRHMQASVALAQAPGHVFLRVAGFIAMTCMHQIAREPRAGRAAAGQAYTLLAGQTLPHPFAPLCTICHGWARAMQDDEEVRLAQLQQGIEAWRGPGTR